MVIWRWLTVNPAVSYVLLPKINLFVVPLYSVPLWDNSIFGQLPARSFSLCLGAHLSSSFRTSLLQREAGQVGLRCRERSEQFSKEESCRHSWADTHENCMVLSSCFFVSEQPHLEVALLIPTWLYSPRLTFSNNYFQEGDYSPDRYK